MLALFGRAHSLRCGRFRFTRDGIGLTPKLLCPIGALTILRSPVAPFYPRDTTMLNKFERKGSFVAMDSALKIYEVVIRQARIEDKCTTIAPRQFLHTLDGRIIGRKQRGEYVMVDSGRVLLSTDPACP